MPSVTTLPLSCDQDTDRFPSALEASCKLPAQRAMSFSNITPDHQARDDFYLSCCQPVLLRLRSKNARYEDILQIDSKIRDFPFPADFTRDFNAASEAAANEPPKPLRVEAMRFLSIQCVNNTLLFLHRPYFQICLRQKANVLADPHLPSVFATMRSACILIRNFDAMERAYPSLMAKITYCWYQVFCAAVRFQSLSSHHLAIAN